MKSLTSSDCFLKSGDLAEAGQIIEVCEGEATALKLAGRGYPAPAEPEPAAEPEKPAKSKK